VTADYVRFHAAERPEAIAVVDNGRDVTYAEFARDIRGVMRALRGFGLPRAAKVAIDCRNVYHDWLLRLACEELCLVSTTFAGRESQRFGSALADFDLVLSDNDELAGEGRRFHAIAPEWMEAILARAGDDEVPVLPKRPEDPLRMLHTSGTTGVLKRLLYSRRMHERSIAQSLWYNGFTRHSRYLLAIPFTVGAPTACVWMGGTVVIENRVRADEAIRARAITHTTLPPILLMRTLDNLPAGFVKPSELAVFCFGAGVSAELRRRALAFLATEVSDMYGSNEIGFVSAARGPEAGTVWPGVEVEIVDDLDRILPLGELGRIRVRTDCMPAGYLGDPEATRRMFRNGWFYAGDMGILRGPRRLQVVGRGDDLLNIGWNKIMPETLEVAALAAVEAADAGVCSLPNADGIEEIHVAFAGVRIDDRELAARLNRAFRGLQLGKIYVIKLPEIPRNAGGKIERGLLKRAVIASGARG